MAQAQGKIEINKLYGGWGDTFASSITALETGPNQYTKSYAIAMNRLGFEGHIAPGFSFSFLTDASVVVSTLPLNGSVDRGGTAYVVQANGNVVFFDPLNATSIAPLDRFFVTGTTSTSTNQGNDLVIYSYNNTAVNPPLTTGEDDYIFWSWDRAAGGADVAKRIRGDGFGGFTANYLTGLANQVGGTALIGNVPHPLLVGQDNNLYIGNGRYLASHDPLGTTVNYKALDLKPGWIITALSVYQSYIAILAYKASGFATSLSKSETKLFFWDGFSPSWNFEYYVRDNFASNLLYDGSDLFVFSQGRNSTTKLKKFNGSGFDTLFENATIGTAPFIGGSDLWLNHLTWVGSGGIYVNGYGSPSETYEKGFHQLGAYPSGAAGLCKQFIQNSLFIGYLDNTSYRIGKVELAGYVTDATFTSQLYTLPTRATITDIKVYFSQFGTGASVQLALIPDYETASFGGTYDLLNTQIDYATYGAIRYFPIVKTIDNINSFRLALKFNHATTAATAAIIRKIEINYLYETENI